MKIAVLNVDDCYLTEGHVARLHKLGELLLYKDTAGEDAAIARLQGVNIALVSPYRVRPTASLFAHTPDLKYLCVNATGTNLVDIEAATARDIKIGNTPGYSTEAVAEHVFALAQAVMRKLVVADGLIRGGLFGAEPSERVAALPLGTGLAGKTFGIYGLGAIGQHAAKIAQGFGMQVIACTRTPKNIPGVREVDFDTLLHEADVLSLHAPLTPETTGLIDGKALAKMKPTAVLINTARGPQVDTEDLIAALKQGRIAGAGLDLLAKWANESPLYAMENVVLTPHVAWFTKEALGRMADVLTGNVEAFVAGRPVNIVN